MESSMTATLAIVGLNEKQAQVYLALLKLGKASSYAVSEASGIKKPTTYVILDELVKKGAALKLPRSNKKMYRAVSPDILMKEAENRMGDAKQLLPALKSLMDTRQEKIQVLHFEGADGFREALYYRAKESFDKEIVGFYSEAEGASKKIIDINEEYNHFLKKNNISTRAFVPDHPSLAWWRNNDAEFNRTVSILPYPIYSSPVSIDTFSNVLRIMMHKNNQAVIIENSELAKTIRQIFEIMWHKK